MTVFIQYSDGRKLPRIRERRISMNCTNEYERPERRPGYSYVPFQRMEKVYSPNKAIKVGTIFPELNIPIEEYERGLFNGK